VVFCATDVFTVTLNVLLSQTIDTPFDEPRQSELINAINAAASRVNTTGNYAGSSPFSMVGVSQLGYSSSAM
jgi:hypothetical protein